MHKSNTNIIYWNKSRIKDFKDPLLVGKLANNSWMEEIFNVLSMKSLDSGAMVKMFYKSAGIEGYDIENSNLPGIFVLWRKAFYLLGEINEDIQEQYDELLEIDHELSGRLIFDFFNARQLYVYFIFWVIWTRKQIGIALLKNVQNKKFLKSLEKISGNNSEHFYGQLYSFYIKPHDESYMVGAVNVNQEKRRYGNDHTLQKRLKEWFDIDIKLPQESNEYNLLCDIFERIMYKPNFIDSEVQTRRPLRIRFGDIFSKESMPLGLFETDDIGNKWDEKYRPYIRDILSQLWQLSSYGIYYKVFEKVFCQSYSQCMNRIYVAAFRLEVTKDILEKQIKLINKKYHLKLYQINLIDGKEDLFSRLLLSFFKCNIESRLRKMEYVFNHSNIENKLILNKEAQENFQRIFQELGGINEGLYSKESLKKIILKDKRAVISKIISSEEVDKVYEKTMSLVENIFFAHNEERPIALMAFISLMICYSVSDKYEIEIVRPKIRRKKVKLSNIICSPQRYQCCEVICFLDSLINAVFLGNIYGEDKVEEYWKIHRYIDEYLMKDMRLVKNWRAMDLWIKKWNEILYTIV